MHSCLLEKWYFPTSFLNFHITYMVTLSIPLMSLSHVGQLSKGHQAGLCEVRIQDRNTFMCICPGENVGSAPTMVLWWETILIRTAQESLNGAQLVINTGNEGQTGRQTARTGQISRWSSWDSLPPRFAGRLQGDRRRLLWDPCERCIRAGSIRVNYTHSVSRKSNRQSTCRISATKWPVIHRNAHKRGNFLSYWYLGTHMTTSVR